MAVHLTQHHGAGSLVLRFTRSGHLIQRPRRPLWSVLRQNAEDTASHGNDADPQDQRSPRPAAAGTPTDHDAAEYYLGEEVHVPAHPAELSGPCPSTRSGAPVQYRHYGRWRCHQTSPAGPSPDAGKQQTGSVEACSAARGRSAAASILQAPTATGRRSSRPPEVTFDVPPGHPRRFEGHRRPRAEAGLKALQGA